MPLFELKDKKLHLALSTNFKLEKDLQTMIEANLETVFNCRFIASEFSTGSEHAGRIDTLALSEDGNPVIIEYKKVESSELVNQSLYYLAWIKDHKGDFQIAASKALGDKVEVDWSDVRVICIAPGYKKFDLHAVKMMGANIELWQYRLFENGGFYLEEIFRKTTSYLPGMSDIDTKGTLALTPGKKAAETRENGSYTYEEHFENVDKIVNDIVNELRELILGLGETVEEAPKKFYVAYKVAQNFVCIQTSKSKVTLFLKLNPKDIKPMPANGRDVSEIGHYGTGNFELILKSVEEIPQAFTYIKKAFEKIGG